MLPRGTTCIRARNRRRPAFLALLRGIDERTSRKHHVDMRGGVPYERVGHFGSPPAPVDGFYVHPRTGLLLDTRSKTKRYAPKPAPPATRKIVDNWTQINWIHEA